MGPRPFMWYLLFNASLQYVVLGFFGDQYDPVISQFERPFVLLWYWGFIISSALILAGASIFRKKFTGLNMQRIGAGSLTMLSAANVALILLILDVSQTPILLALISISTFAIAAAVHFWDVHRYMNQLQSLADTRVTEEPK